MTDFVALRVYPTCHFGIKHDRQRYWIAGDRHRLADGTFRTHKDSLRFALFESGGDSAHVHAYPEAQAACNNKRPHPRVGELS
jgi:hypothetical protein